MTTASDRCGRRSNDDLPRNNRWRWELAIVVGICVAIKLYLRGATEVVCFDWLLWPTTLVVESVTGLEFIFDPRHGYTNFARRYVISPACAGVNFLVMSLLLIWTRLYLDGVTSQSSLRRLLVTIGVALAATFMTNSARITVAIWIQPEGWLGWFKSDDGHRALGILIYSTALWLISISLERLAGLSQERWWLPALVYVGVTVLVPLLSGGWLINVDGFMAHTVVVLCITSALSVTAWTCLKRRATGT